MTADGEFVGRAAEAATALAVLGGPDERALVLGGQAGVGKTRLAQELAAAWRAEGRNVVWMAGTAGTRTLPFGAVARLLTVSEGPARTETAAVGDASTHTAAVISEAIRAAGADPDRLVVVDDAHLLDGLSALLVHHLVLERVVPVLLTVRSGEAVEPSLASLWADGHAARLDVLNLSTVESAAVVHQLLGVDACIAPATLDALHAASDGNPLLLGELVRDAVDAGALHSDAGGVWRWDVPARAPRGRRLRDAIRRRLGSTTDAERRLLVLLSVAEPLEVDLARRLAPDVDLDALEQRVLVKVVEDGQRLEVRLAHPLLGEVLHDELAMEERARVRDDIGAALGDWPIRRRNDVLRRAAMLLEAGSALPDDVLVEAGERALVVGATGLAERLARLAADHSVGAGGLLGRALGFQERYAEARAALEHAMTLTGDDAALVGVAWYLHFLDVNAGDPERALEVLRAARDRVDDPVWQAIVEGHEIQLLLNRGRSREGTARAERLLAEHDDPRVRLRLVSSAGQGWALAGRTDEALALAEGLLPQALALSAELPLAPAWVVNAQSVALLLAGRLDQAANLVAAVGQLAAAQPEAADGLGMLALLSGRIELSRGHVGRAVAELAQALGSWTSGDLGGLRRWALSLHAEALALSGDHAAASLAVEAAEHVEVSSLAFEGDAIRARAWAIALGGEVSRAVELLLEVADLQALEGQHALEMQSLHAVVRLGAADRVGGRLDDVLARVDGRWPAPMRLHLEGLRRGDGAVLDDAGAAFADLGAHLHAAEAWSEAARLHERAGLRSRASASARHRDDALASCGDVTPRTPALSDATSRAELTRREREVVLLASQGLSNRAIAERLVVSLRTVEGHLYRAFTKIGVTEREQLNDLVL